MMISEVPVFSPVRQDFIWVAEYMDGNHLAEYDFNTREENNFYEIMKNNLIRFGLIGHGFRMYYEVFGGFFKIGGQMIEVVYKTDDKEYFLTGQQKMYNDIIQYKDSEATFNFALANAGEAYSEIVQHTFGYKVSLPIEDVNFNFKAQCKVPLKGNQPVYMNFRVVADKELSGILQIRKNGRVVEEIDAPLKEDIGGEFNWFIQ
ncbi:hypothetical protein AAXB25_14565 [Paenibacillus lautus]|uniref:hypothetical protein n=1 Tax=Paenibacillus lautus TaxID=1401 RepID=UPI003D26EA4A